MTIVGYLAYSDRELSIKRENNINSKVRTMDMIAHRKALSKSRLAIVLSKLQVFREPKVADEQYPTDAEVAASVLWQAHLMGDLKGKVTADLGSGTGILGIGMLLMGATKVYLVERDVKATQIAEQNLKRIRKDVGSECGNVEFRNQDVETFCESVDLVLQNPPFGTKVRHSDKRFLEKAFELAEKTYSFHKSGSEGFLAKLAKDKGFRITHRLDFDFPLKQTQKFHRKRIYRPKVSCFRFERV
jgi:putative methylase